MNFRQSVINHLEITEQKTLDDFKNIIKETNKTIFVFGNGGSSALASHFANDIAKTLNKKIALFSDASLVTCFSNDYGYENAVSEFLDRYEDDSILAIIISSSGNSRNIINLVDHCINRNIDFIGLSGMDKDCYLRAKSLEHGLLSFHVDSRMYSTIESVHFVLLHSVCDEI